MIAVTPTLRPTAGPKTAVGIGSGDGQDRRHCRARRHPGARRLGRAAAIPPDRDRRRARLRAPDPRDRAGRAVAEELAHALTGPAGKKEGPPARAALPLSIRGPSGPPCGAYAARTSTEARIQVAHADDRGI